MRQVYIAAKWEDKDRLPAIAAQFEEQGYHVTERWWEHPEIPGFPSTTTPAEDFECRDQARKDINGVILADVFVLLNGEKSEGKAVELGCAIACRKPIVIIGERTNLFHWLEDINIVPTVEDALRLLPRVLHYFR